MNTRSRRNLRIRRARKSDSERLRRWRNDPQTRKNSFQNRVITKKEHEAWIAKMLESEESILLIAAKSKHHPIGVIRYEIRNPQTAEIHVNLAPNERGKGWGSPAIRQANAWVKKNTGIKTVVARVKPENAASYKVFLKAGFADNVRKKNFCEMRLNLS